MAAISSPLGYPRELFVRPVPEDFLCGLCKEVARDAYLTTCCGEQFCKLCIEQVSTKGDKLCPSCQEAGVSFFINKRDQKRILALEVRCPMKDRGCDWTESLQNLAAHLDVNSGNCQYVDVECPYRCSQPVHKRDLPTHLADKCSKRDFTCQYCNFKATYEVVSNDHWPECRFYPVPCPNGCEILAIERGDLDAHLLLCSLQEVECDFNYAGCNVKLVREEMEKHLADNLQRHVLMMNKALQEKIKQKEEKIEELEQRLEEKDEQIQELRREKDQQIKEMQEKINRKTQEIQEKHDQTVCELEEKDRQIEESLDLKIQELQLEKVKHILETQEKNDRQLQEIQNKTQTLVARVEKDLNSLRRMVEGIEWRAGLLIMMPGFTKVIKANAYWHSPALCTHSGGYKISIVIHEFDGHVAVYPIKLKGENDDRLTWPADCTITLKLLNQHRDQDHVTVSKRFQWKRPTAANGPIPGYISRELIAIKDLGWNTDKQTKYLANDSLRFKISRIEVHSM